MKTLSLEASKEIIQAKIRALESQKMSPKLYMGAYGFDMRGYNEAINIEIVILEQELAVLQDN